jgi:hypothetical protein
MRGLVLSGGHTTPIQGRIGERPHVGSVNSMVSGCVSYRSEDREIQLNPSPKDTVFSREFRNRFGLRASDLLREGGSHRIESAPG